MGEHLSIETIDRLRTWTFFGVVVCAGLMIGLSNAVWSNGCGKTDILGGLSIIGGFCNTVTGAESHVLFGGLADGQAMAIAGLALLVTCGLAFAFPRSRGMWMVYGTIVGLGALVIAGSAASEYGKDGTLSQSLILLTAASIAAPFLSGLFVWLDIRHDQATTNGDSEAWAS